MHVWTIITQFTRKWMTDCRLIIAYHRVKWHVGIYTKSYEKAEP